MSRCIVRCVGIGLLALASVGLSGCLVISDNSHDPVTPTVGKELRDLKVARDQGALDPDEYRDARQKVLARLDKPRGT